MSKSVKTRMQREEFFELMNKIYAAAIGQGLDEVHIGSAAHTLKNLMGVSRAAVYYWSAGEVMHANNFNKLMLLCERLNVKVQTKKLLIVDDK